MNKTELVSSISVSTGVSKETANKIMDGIIDGIKQNLTRGKDVRIAGLGRFHTTERKERMGRNPRTGESLKIPAKTVVKFTPYSDLADEVNKK